MDLVEALEQLTIHVKSREDPQAPNCSNLGENASQRDWQYSPLSGGSGSNRNVNSEQLKQFETSIDTLFSQINDLDHDHCQRDIGGNVPRFNTNQLTAPRITGGSLETSQEEDSDNSSQQSSSGYATSNTSCSRPPPPPASNPLVVSLMKRNLQNITNTVRKLGTILSLGIQIEFIYRHQLPKAITFDRHSEAYRDLITRSMSTCDSFLELFSSEPPFAHLQTLVRYKQSCQLLMQRIDELSSSHLLSTIDGRPIEAFDSTQTDGDYDMSLGDEDADDDAQDALDCALLECDQSQLDSNVWTDNQLYVNNVGLPPRRLPTEDKFN